MSFHKETKNVLKKYLGNKTSSRDLTRSVNLLLLMNTEINLEFKIHWERQRIHKAPLSLTRKNLETRIFVEQQQLVLEFQISSTDSFSAACQGVLNKNLNWRAAKISRGGGLKRKLKVNKVCKAIFNSKQGNQLNRD